MSELVLVRPAVLVLVCSMSSAAYSQANTPASDGIAIENVTVTAQKRNEDIQDVPISITAMTAEVLSSGQIDTTKALEQAVPALVYGRSAGYAAPFLRGVGTDLSGPNTDPSVATYIDGAFVADNNATIQSLLGVERVEVLAGPQGTLYGRNAVGGAINVITLTPTQETRAKVSAGIGNYSRQEGSVQFSGGVTEDLTLGVYAGGSIQDRWLKTVSYALVYDDFREPEHEKQWGVRVKGVYTPTDWLKLTGSLEKVQSAGVQAAELRSISPNNVGYLLFPELPKIDEFYKVQKGTPTYLKVSQTAATLREEVDLGWARLLGISAFRDTLTQSQNDPIAVGVPILYFYTNNGSTQHWSQELQLISAPESKIEWIAGLYYFHDWGGYLPNVSASPILFTPPHFSTENFGRVVTESYAAFAQTTVPVTDRLRVTVGGRVTTDKKRHKGYQTYSTSDDQVAMPTVKFPSDDHKWNKFTPKLGVDYKLGSTLLYATYSEGFKSGSYNLAVPTDVEPVDPEKLKAYEVGAKSELFNGRMIWNTAVYYYDQKDIQVNIVNSSGFTIRDNATSAKLKGLETSVKLAATRELTLGAAAAFQDTEYRKFTDYSGLDSVTLAPVTVDVSGNRLQRSPKAVLTAGVQYEKPLISGSKLGGTLNWYHNSGYYFSPQNTSKQESYDLLNANVSYTRPGDRWRVDLWGRNLTNKKYLVNILPIPGLSLLATDAPPREYGLTMSYSFE